MDTCTFDLWCSSSVITLSVNPLQACLAPQYGACRGMPRKARAELTWTSEPRSRGTIRFRAACVPQTIPR